MDGVSKGVELLQLLNVVVDFKLVLHDLHLERVQLLLGQTTVFKEVTFDFLQKLHWIDLPLDVVQQRRVAALHVDEGLVQTDPDAFSESLEVFLVGLCLHLESQLLVFKPQLGHFRPQHVNLLLQLLLLVRNHRVDSREHQSALLLGRHQVVDELAAVLV